MVTGRFHDEFKLPYSTLQRINIQDEEVIATFADDLNKFLTSFEEIDLTFLKNSLNSTIKEAEIIVEELQSSCYKTVKKMEERVLPKKGSAKKKKNGKKSKGRESETTASSAETDKSNSELKEEMPRLVSEWKAAIEGEVDRLKVRLSLLYSNSLRLFAKYIGLARNMFKDVYDAITHKYDNEIQSIETVCEIFARATEQEVPIEPELILDLDQFRVNHRELLYEKLPHLFPDPFLHIETGEETFSLQQLSSLVDILMDLAPSGLIAERSLIYLLQDLLVNNTEDGTPNLMPKLWHKMKPNDFNKLSELVFNRCEYVTWKDFILWNLQINFPSEYELLSFRKNALDYDPDVTELIKDYQLDEIKFWFDRYTLEKNRTRIREILFKMYAINEDTVNYTAMLLDFCKDADPVVGFVKALELSMGKILECLIRNVGLHK